MYEIWELAGALLVVFLGAALQGSVGFGFAVLSAPILALLDPGFVPVAPQILQLPLTVAALLREHGGIDKTGLGWVLFGRLPGTLLAALVLSVAVGRTLDLLIGSIVLVAVLILASGARVPLNPYTRFFAGVFSGFSGTASSIGGPPIALLYRYQTGPTVRSTLGVIFAVGVSINLVVLAVTGIADTDDVVTALILAPAATLGFAGSSLLHRHVEGRILRTGILVVSSIAAVGLLIRTVLG
jgi:uncharacterized protein